MSELYPYIPAFFFLLTTILALILCEFWARLWRRSHKHNRDLLDLCTKWQENAEAWKRLARGGPIE